MAVAALWLACLAPLLRLIYLGMHARLGANPVEFVEHWTGDWALNLLCVTLAVSPLSRLTGWSWWMGRRRALGLFSFLYAALHFSTYLWLDMELRAAEFFRDVNRRPYIFVGFAALALMSLLAATSTDWAIRRLGRWWQRLHRLIYPAAVLAVVHYLWLVKADKSVPSRYAAVVALLLGLRVYLRLKRNAAPA